MFRENPRYTEFVWDDRKRQRNLEKHGIDFKDAAHALKEPHLEFESPRSGEYRVLAICPDSGGILFYCVHTVWQSCLHHICKEGEPQ